MMYTPVTYIGVDFTRQDLRSAIQTAGLDREERMFVIWEGVTHYIGEAAVDFTLRARAEMIAPGSRLLFTYIHRGLIDGTVEFEGSEHSKSRVASEGEPWIYGITPADLPAFLSERGFELIEDIGAADYRTRYWGERGRCMKGFDFYRATLAQVRGR